MNFSFDNSTENNMIKKEESQEESCFSNYLNYLDSFQNNYQKQVLQKNVDDSDSNLKQEFQDEQELQNLLFQEEDSNMSMLLNHLDQDSFIKERDDYRILNKSLNSFNFGLKTNKNRDFSFASKTILSLLQEQSENEEEQNSLEFSFKEIKKNKYIEQLFSKRKKQQKILFSNNFQECFLITRLESNQQYFLLKNGILNSLRNTNHNNIVFGRSDNFDDIYPNDIVINDSHVSRIHCMINTSLYFNRKKILLQKKQKLKNLIFNKIPSNLIFEKIFNFLKKKKGFYLQDLGSTDGTFLNLKEQKKLNKGDVIILGDDAKLKVIAINQKNKFEKIDKKIQINQEDIQLIGFRQNIINQKQILKKNFILFETNNCSSNIKKYIVFKAKQDRIYQFGRKEDIDVLLNLQDISRIHSELYYQKNNWYIKDGNGKNLSKNGTWIKLRQKNKSLYSEKILLNFGSKFKISNKIFNFNHFQYQLIFFIIQIQNVQRKKIEFQLITTQYQWYINWQLV